MSLLAVSAALCLDLVSRLLGPASEAATSRALPGSSTWPTSISDWPRENESTQFFDSFNFGFDPNFDDRDEIDGDEDASSEDSFKVSFEDFYGKLEDIYKLTNASSESDPMSAESLLFEAGLDPFQLRVANRSESITFFFEIDEDLLDEEDIGRMGRMSDFDDMDTGDSNHHEVVYNGQQPQFQPIVPNDERRDFGRLRKSRRRKKKRPNKIEENDVTSRLLSLIREGDAGYLDQTQEEKYEEQAQEEVELLIDPSGPVGPRPGQDWIEMGLTAEEINVENMREDQDESWLKEGRLDLMPEVPATVVAIVEPRVQATVEAIVRPTVEAMVKQRIQDTVKAVVEQKKMPAPTYDPKEFYKSLKQAIKERILERTKQKKARITTTVKPKKIRKNSSGEPRSLILTPKSKPKPKTRRRRPQQQAELSSASLNPSFRRVSSSRRDFYPSGSASGNRRMFGFAPKVHPDRMPYAGIRNTMRGKVHQWKRRILGLKPIRKNSNLKYRVPSTKKPTYRPYRYRPTKGYNTGSIYSMMPALLGVGSLLGFGLGSFYVDGEVNNFTFNPTITYQGDNTTFSTFDQNTMTNNVRQTNSNRVTNTVNTNNNNTNTNTVVPIIINADGTVDVGAITGNGKRRRRRRRGLDDEWPSDIQDVLKASKMPNKRIMRALKRLLLPQDKAGKT